jgi:protoheme IX farnesyltransferase
MKIIMVTSASSWCLIAKTIRGELPVHEENAWLMLPESADIPACPAVPVGGMQKAGALLRMARPGIVTAELTAALAGMLLASSTIPTAGRLFWVILCVALAASGAAMSNSLIESVSDRLMPRLALRCQALDLVGVKVVRVAAAGCIGTSLVLAVIFINMLTVLLLGAALFFYLFLYSARMKHTSPLAVLAGGIPGALPPLIGAAAAGSLPAAPLLLAVVLYIWQMPHFWFLALQCREQYQQARVPVFPLVYGERLTKILILAGNALIIPLTLLLSIFSRNSTSCTVLLLLTGVFLFFSSVWAVRRHYRCRHGFFGSLAYLAILLTALIMDALVRQPWHIFSEFSP